MDLGIVLVSFIAGLVSVLTPCVLPLLPALLAVSSDGGRPRVFGLVLGVVVSFCLALLVFASAIRALGLPDDTMRIVSASILVVFGAVLVVNKLDEWVQVRISRVTSRLPAGATRSDRKGALGGFLTGLALGIVWAPCAGPILAGITVASATSSVTSEIVVQTIALGVGMSIPLTAIALGGKRVADGVRNKVGARRLLTGMGVVLIATGAYIALDLDVRANKWLAETFGISSTPTASLEGDALRGDAVDSDDHQGRPSTKELEANGYPANKVAELVDLGPAPEFAGLTNWFNTDGDKLTLKSLRGKVVLVDFWTYTCINCVRTLPYIKKWHSRYEKDGLVIVGVHAPEFQFEHDPDNVQDAIGQYKLKHPIALDNEFETWRNFYNRYWPAKYLIDRDGNLRYVHYGEGEYAGTEQLIRELLKLERMKESGESEERNLAASPETYLGYERGQSFAGHVKGKPGTPFVADVPTEYTAPANLNVNQWSFSGQWTIEDERSVAGKDAVLHFHYRAADVFLVAGHKEKGKTGTLALTDGTPTNTTESRTIDVKEQNLYVLRDTDKQNDATVRIEASPGVAVYAFTFG